MVKGTAILLATITIGISGCNPAVAQDCFYSQRTFFKDGGVVDDIKRYDCKTPPKTIIIENEYDYQHDLQELSLQKELRCQPLIEDQV